VLWFCRGVVGWLAISRRAAGRCLRSLETRETAQALRRAIRARLTTSSGTSIAPWRDMTAIVLHGPFPSHADLGYRARASEITVPDVGDALPVPRAPRARFSWARWLAACTLGELVGFGAAALFALGALTTVGLDPVTPFERAGLVAWMALAGVFEGAVLGTMQWLALRRIFPRLSARGFVGATVTVAALGWTLGMLPAALAPPDSSAGPAEPSFFFVIAASVVFGAMAGALFGFAQWLAVRSHARSASRWIGANALGWALGLPWSFAAGALGDLGVSVPLAVAIAVAGGALMGASVAVATGLALRRIEPRGR
jgi:hypothetical protein